MLISCRHFCMSSVEQLKIVGSIEDSVVEENSDKLTASPIQTTYSCKVLYKCSRRSLVKIPNSSGERNRGRASDVSIGYRTTSRLKQWQKSIRMLSVLPCKLYIGVVKIQFVSESPLQLFKSQILICIRGISNEQGVRLSSAVQLRFLQDL